MIHRHNVVGPVSQRVKLPLSLARASTKELFIVYSFRNFEIFRIIYNFDCDPGLDNVATRCILTFRRSENIVTL